MKRRYKGRERVEREKQLIALNEILIICKRHKWNPKDNWNYKDNFTSSSISLGEKMLDVFPTLKSILDTWKKLNVSQHLKISIPDSAPWNAFLDIFIDTYYEVQNEYGRLKYQKNKESGTALVYDKESSPAIEYGIIEPEVIVNNPSFRNILIAYYNLTQLDYELQDYKEGEDDELIQDLIEQKEVIFKTLKPEEVTEYIKLNQETPGKVASKVRKRNCLNCNQSVPSQILVEIKNPNKFYHCPYCKTILVAEEIIIN